MSNTSPRNAPLLGVHVSTKGGLLTAFDRAEKLGINTFQLFVKNNKQWFAEPLETELVAQFRARRRKWAQAGPLVAHACYLINLASRDPVIQDKSRRSFEEEWLRAEALGVDHLVFHPGCHTGGGEELGIANIAAAINDIHRANPEIRCKTVFEITAGMGTSVGSSFIHLERILDQVHEVHRVGICLDTCHMLATGIDVRTREAWDGTFAEFEERIGLDKLVCIHTNDSKKGLGSKLDRHEHIGKGEVGLEGFRLLMNDPRLAAIPKILETPKDDEMTEDYENLATLRGLIVS